MSARQDFLLPEFPPGCLKCGGLKPVSPYKVNYRGVGGGAGTLLGLLIGMLVYTETTYVLRLPLCAPCAANRGRKWLVLFSMVPVVGGLFVLSVWYGLEHPGLFALPVVAALVLLIWGAVYERRATPKAVRVTTDTLVINVPGHGHLTLVGQDPTRRARPAAEPRREQAPPRRQEPAGPRLNRSVCDGCGFINFASAFECKKCRAPLGHAATV